MSEETKQPETAPAVASSVIVGRCIEVGDDDAGNPMILIHTTREALMNFAENIVYRDVAVTLHQPNKHIDEL